METYIYVYIYISKSIFEIAISDLIYESYFFCRIYKQYPKENKYFTLFLFIYTIKKC